MMCKLNLWMEKGGHYDGNERVDATGSNMMCKLNGQMGNGGYDDVQMKIGWKRWHYDVRIKRADG